MFNFTKRPSKASIISAITMISLLGVASVSLATATNYPIPVPTFIAGWRTPQITPEEIQQGKEKPAMLIDVRSPEEYAEDKIGDSPLVPFTDIEAGFGVNQIQTLVKANTKPNQPSPTVILYCHSGPRSFRAYQKLKEAGLDTVVLTGGITDWRKQFAVSQDMAILAKIR